MDAGQLLMLLFAVVLTVTTVKSCQVTYEWKALTLEQTVSGADIVVFGQESEHVRNTRWSWGTDAVFHVYCVLKTDGGPAIPEKIIVESVRPVHSCMGTWTRLGEVMMLALKRTESGNFRWNELGIMQTAKFAPTQLNLQRALHVVGVDSLRTPEGRDPLTQPGCPWPKVDKSHEEEEEEEDVLPKKKGSDKKLLTKLLKRNWLKKEQAVEMGDMWRTPGDQGSREEQSSGDLHIEP